MSIQSLKGTVGTSPPQPAPAQSNPAPVPVAAVNLPEVPAQSVSRPPPTQEQLQQALEKLKHAVPAKASALQFSLDDSSGQMIARIVDGETGELIRQIPSEELLDIAHALDKMQGMLLKQKA